MAMQQPALWSVNALATEFGLDRRTAAKRLAKVPPAGEKAGHPAWRLADAAPALMGRPQMAQPTGDAPPPPPPGFAWLAGLPSHDAVAALALMMLAYRLPPAVASLAVAAGAPCRAAFATAQAMHLAGVQLAAEVARDCGLRPWVDEADPEVIAPDCFAGINWPALAAMAGEPLDRDAWAAWARERFAA